MATRLVEVMHLATACRPSRNAGLRWCTAWAYFLIESLLSCGRPANKRSLTAADMRCGRESFVLQRAPPYTLSNDRNLQALCSRYMRVMNPRFSR
jgi:hypothetical protein